MSVNTIDYVGPQPTNSAAAIADTRRGPTEFIWDGYPPINGWIADFVQDPSLGMHFFDDFLCTGQAAVGIFPALAALTLGSMGNWAFIAPVGGGFGDAGIIGGAVALAAGSLAGATSVQVAEVIYSNVGAFQITTASSGGLQGRLAFEARLGLTSVTNGKRDVFLGLIDQAPQSSAGLQAGFPFGSAAGSAASVSSSNNLNSVFNLIGFYFPSASYASSSTYGSACPSGDCAFVFQLKNTAPVFCKNMGGLISNVGGSSILAATGSSNYYKLGFIYDPNPPRLPITVPSDGQTAGNIAGAMIRVFVNGIQAAAFQTQTNNVLTASFPTGIMGPIAAINPTASGNTNTGTASAGLLNLDWLRVAQIATG